MMLNDEEAAEHQLLVLVQMGSPAVFTPQCAEEKLPCSDRGRPARVLCACRRSGD